MAKRGKGAKRKGDRGERELMDFLLGDGLRVGRVFGSGSGKYQKGDILLRFRGRTYTIECKREQTLPLKGLEGRQDGSDILMMRQDREEWKVYMGYDIFVNLLLTNRS